MTAKMTIGFVAGLALLGAAPLAQAETALEEALSNGARPLTVGQIAERFAGKTGTWVSASGDRRMLVYYGQDNDLHATPVGAEGSAAGYYGIADTDSICISRVGRDKGRLRCLDVLVVDGVVTKFNADGSLNGTYERFENGKAF